MKAVRLNEWGQPVQIEELAQPTPSNDEVLVRIHAAGVNPMEKYIALGYFTEMFSVPLTLGRDFAGEVVSVGSNVHHVKAGDAVFGMSPMQSTFAEYATINAQGVALKPKTLDDVQAAAVPVVALSAWQTVFNMANLQAGERILIHGAGGGIGAFAVQLAKNAGAYVIGLGKSDQAAFIQELGTDQFVDADTQRFEDVIEAVDVILDLVGGDYVDRSLNFLNSGGRYIATAAMLPEDAGKEQGVIAMGAYTQPSNEELSKLAEAIDAGELKVFVNRTFPIEEAQTAIFYQPEDGTFGKVVLTTK